MGKDKFYKEGSQVALNRSYDVLQQQKTFAGFTGGGGHTRDRRGVRGRLPKRVKNRRMQLNLPNVYFLLTGGIIKYNGNPNILTVETRLYNYTKNTWERIASLNEYRVASNTVSLNGVPYTLGGSAFQSGKGWVPTNTAEFYDRKANAWSSFNIGRAIWQAGAAVKNNKIYLVSGFALSNPALPNALYTDGIVISEDRQYKSITGMVAPRRRFNLVALPDRDELLALGGQTSGSPFINTAEKYDIKKDSWSFITPPPRRRYGAGAAIIGKKVYVFGGTEDKSPAALTASMDIYDYTTDTWTQGPPMLRERGGFSSVVHNGKIHVFGGYSLGPTPLEDGEIYTPGKGWTVSKMKGVHHRAGGDMVIL